MLTVLTAADGTRGFSIGLEQLARHKAMWLPEHDVFVTLADAPVDFAAHLASLKGERVLDRVKHEPEATLAEWTNKWADFGNPDPAASRPGNRLAGHPRPPHRALSRGTARSTSSAWTAGRACGPTLLRRTSSASILLWPGWQWTGQRIVDGLPILVTALEREGQRCEVEQFAAPLRDAPRGETRRNRQRAFSPGSGSPAAGPLSFGFRLATENTNRHPELREAAGRWCVVDRETGAVWLMVEPDAGLTLKPRARHRGRRRNPRIEFDCVGELAAGETRTVVLKLASPVVLADAAAELAALDFGRARAAR